jgi:hypothetical protein
MQRRGSFAAAIRVSLRWIERWVDVAAGDRGSDEPRLDGGNRLPHRDAEAAAFEGAIDMSVALALVGVGIVVIIVPSATPGLVPTMTPMRPA